MQQFQQQVHQIAPQVNPKNGNWHPGNEHSQALEWAVQALAKAGTISIIGVYPLTYKFFPIGAKWNRDVHRRTHWVWLCDRSLWVFLRQTSRFETV